MDGQGAKDAACDKGFLAHFGKPHLIGQAQQREYLIGNPKPLIGCSSNPIGHGFQD